MPSIDLNTFGLIVVALIGLSQWWWTSKKFAREEAAQFEPRHDPQLHEKYATRDEVHELEQEIKDQIKDLIQRMDRDEAAAAQSRKRIYDEIYKLGKLIATVQTKGDITSQQLVQMSTKIDNLHTRICQS